MTRLADTSTRIGGPLQGNMRACKFYFVNSFLYKNAGMNLQQWNMGMLFMEQIESSVLRKRKIGS